MCGTSSCVSLLSSWSQTKPGEIRYIQSSVLDLVPRESRERGGPGFQLHTTQEFSSVGVQSHGGHVGKVGLVGSYREDWGMIKDFCGSRNLCIMSVLHIIPTLLA